MRRPKLVLVAALLAGACDADRGGFGPLPSTTTASPSPTRATSRPPPAGAPVVVRTPGNVYEPLSVTLGFGRETVVELRNTDRRPHALTVNELSLQMVAEPGETVRLAVTPGLRGSFVMYCSIAGHRDDGHQGRLLVR